MDLRKKRKQKTRRKPRRMHTKNKPWILKILPLQIFLMLLMRCAPGSWYLQYRGSSLLLLPQNQAQLSGSLSLCLAPKNPIQSNITIINISSEYLRDASIRPYSHFCHLIGSSSSPPHYNKMTLNCPVNQMGQPLAVPQQTFILFRPYIQFEVTIEGVGSKKAKGTAYLTNYRIIFVNEKPDPQITSFDIPIANLYGQEVKFPIFGSTYLQGSSTPFQKLLPGNSHFKLYFKKGGCDRFIKVLSLLIKEVRKALNSHMAYEQSHFFNQVRSGAVNFSAYSDPSDPSVIYTEQPKP